MGADGDGVAAVVMVEGLRVGSAMLCPQGVMGDAVAPKRWLSRPPPCGGRACAAGAAEHLAAEGDGVAPVGLVEALRVGSAMLCPQGVMGNAVAPKRWLSRPPPAAGGPARRGVSRQGSPTEVIG